MIEIHKLTPNERDLALNIQAALNSGDYEEVRSFLRRIEADDADDAIEVEGAITENLMSGTTFTINDPDNVSSTGNSLLHVALRARVDNDVMEQLIGLGVNYSAELHVNSKGLTPVRYADEYFQEYYNVMGLRDQISDYYNTHTNEYDNYLAKLVKEEVQNNRIEDNTITIDIGPMVWQNEERSMFNSSESIADHIHAFIDLSQCPNATCETEGTTITFICEDENSDIALLAQVEDIL